jgi:hypothetical protein
MPVNLNTIPRTHRRLWIRNQVLALVAPPAEPKSLMELCFAMGITSEYLVKHVLFDLLKEQLVTATKITRKWYPPTGGQPAHVEVMVYGLRSNSAGSGSGRAADNSQRSADSVRLR